MSNEETIDAQHIEYLALGRGHNERGVVGMLTVRLNPEDSMEVHNLNLTLDQVLRLRDDLNFEFDQDEFPEKNREYPDELED